MKKQTEKLIEIADNLRDVRTSLDDELLKATHEDVILNISWRHEQVDDAIKLIESVAHDKDFIPADELKSCDEDMKAEQMRDIETVETVSFLANLQNEKGDGEHE